MSREVHVRFWEGLGLKCPGLLTKEPETWDIATYHEFWYLLSECRIYLSSSFVSMVHQAHVTRFHVI